MPYKFDPCDPCCGSGPPNPPPPPPPPPTPTVVDLYKFTNANPPALEWATLMRGSTWRSGQELSPTGIGIVPLVIIPTASVNYYFLYGLFAGSYLSDKTQSWSTPTSPYGSNYILADPTETDVIYYFLPGEGKFYRYDGVNDTLAISTFPTTVDVFDSTPPFVGLLGRPSTISPEILFRDTYQTLISIKETTVSGLPATSLSRYFITKTFYNSETLVPNLSERIETEDYLGQTNITHNGFDSNLKQGPDGNFYKIGLERILSLDLRTCYVFQKISRATGKVILSKNLYPTFNYRNIGSVNPSLDITGDHWEIASCVTDNEAWFINTKTTYTSGTSSISTLTIKSLVKLNYTTGTIIDIVEFFRSGVSYPVTDGSPIRYLMSPTDRTVIILYTDGYYNPALPIAGIKLSLRKIDENAMELWRFKFVNPSGASGTSVGNPRFDKYLNIYYDTTIPGPYIQLP